MRCVFVREREREGCRRWS